MDNSSKSERPLLSGHHPARLDDKGRMKLSVDVTNHLAVESDKRIFITSIVPGRASLYPMRVWQENLRTLRSMKVNVPAAERIERYANVNGGVTELDAQGRVLVPIKLRQKFDLESDGLMLVPNGERLDIYKQSEMESVNAEDEAELAASISSMQELGVRL